MDSGVLPDVEVCFAEYLLPLVDDPSHIGNFVITDYQTEVVDQGWEDTPFIELHARGGEFDEATFTAWPVLEVLCWGKSREVAVQTAMKVMKMIVLDNVQQQFVAGDGFFDSASDITGSQEQETVSPDDRCVTRTFQLECRPEYDN